METIYLREDLNLLKVTDLKEILRIRELKLTGKKEELISRILNSQKNKLNKDSTVEPLTEIKKESPRLPVYEAKHYSTFIQSLRDSDLLLGDISWIISDYPRTRGYNITMGTRLEKNSPYLGYVGGQKIFEIPRDELENVVFDTLVAITVPQLKKNNKGNYFIDYDAPKTFLLEPNKKYGSTLGYVLESIYRHIYNIPQNSKLKDVKDLYKDIDIEYPFFEGLEKPTKTSPSYKVIFGN